MSKILVIEDAHSLRRDILEMLSFEGFEVSGAENGLIGVETARQIKPDLIICDIMMPAMDGFGVLDTLRHDASTATIPFIFLTARTDRVDLRQGMELGADDYLTKPFTASELLASVQTRLTKRAALQDMAEQKLEDLRDNIILALPHEMRTPLNVILGFSDMLMNDFSTMEPAQMGEMAQHINAAAMRLYRLIENFLIYANVELLLASPEQLAAIRSGTSMGPSTLVQNVATHRAQHLGRADDLVLNVGDAPAIQIAEDNLKKVVEELVDNALKFSTAGTKVTINAEVRDDRYVIKVTDQGRGMTPEQIASVGAYMQFDRRFYEQQGSGLGLVIAKRLVELYEGNVLIESVLNQGTSVTISLRLRAP